MIKVDIEKVKLWKAAKRHTSLFAVPKTILISCPNKNCDVSLVNMPLEWGIHGDVFGYSDNECSGCGQRIRLFVVDPPRWNDSETVDASHALVMIVPPQKALVDVDNVLTDLSPEFAEIYRQAAESELYGLTAISGIGYRKALEFLIKDYLVFIKPDEEGLIKGGSLGQCIGKYLDDDGFKEVAARTGWLGNDEAHYVKKWEGKDLDDLKLLLTATMAHVASKYRVKKLVDSMPNAAKK